MAFLGWLYWFKLGRVSTHSLTSTNYNLLMMKGSAPLISGFLQVFGRFFRLQAPFSELPSEAHVEFAYGEHQTKRVRVITGGSEHWDPGKDFG